MFQLDSVNKKLEQKTEVNRHPETVANFLREENEQFANEEEEIEKHNKRMLVFIFFIFFYP